MPALECSVITTLNQALYLMFFDTKLPGGRILEDPWSMQYEYYVLHLLHHVSRKKACWSQWTGYDVTYHIIPAGSCLNFEPSLVKHRRGSTMVYPLCPVLNRDSGTTLGTSWHILASWGQGVTFQKLNNVGRVDPQQPTGSLLNRTHLPCFACLTRLAARAFTVRTTVLHGYHWECLGFRFSMRWKNRGEFASTAWTLAQLLCQILTISMSAKRLNQSTNIY